MTLTAFQELDLLPPNTRGDNRNKNWGDFRLVEVDRSNVVDSISIDDEFDSDGVFAVGAMRENCPYCQVSHLKLVLRQKRVRHAHLFCELCEKCFDMRNLDGTSALELSH
jgi:hypothetical protein